MNWLNPKNTGVKEGEWISNKDEKDFFLIWNILYCNKNLYTSEFPHSYLMWNFRMGKLERTLKSSFIKNSKYLGLKWGFCIIGFHTVLLLRWNMGNVLHYTSHIQLAINNVNILHKLHQLHLAFCLLREAKCFCLLDRLPWTMSKWSFLTRQAQRD